MSYNPEPNTHQPQASDEQQATPTTRPPRKTIRNIGINVLLSLFSLVVSLVVAEYGFQLYQYGTIISGAHAKRWNATIQPDTTLGWSKKPNSVDYLFREEYYQEIRINSLGLRDHEYAYAKPDGVFRVLILGDSFVEAIEVSLQQTFAKELERILNEAGRIGKKVEVINGGTRGYDTVQELRFLETEGLKYKPDLVVLAFCPNDLPDPARISGQNVTPSTRATSPPAPVKNAGESSPVRGSAKRWLRENSALYRYIRSRVKYGFPALAGSLQKFGLIKAGQEPDLVNSDIQRFYGESSPADRDYLSGLFSNLKNLAHTHHFIPVVFTTPLREQVYPKDWEMSCALYKINPAEYDLDRLKNMVSELCNDLGLQFVDMLTVFRKEAASRRLHFHFDGHWNANGHAAVAQELGRVLLTETNSPLAQVAEQTGIRSH